MKGWARRAGNKPAAFVLFAYRTDGATAIPFAVAPTGDTNSSLVRRRLRNCGFEIDFDVSALPTEDVEVSAWAVDPGQGEVAQLAMLHRIQWPRIVHP